MDEQLRRTLNDRLDGLQAGDVFPDFDRNGTWETMQRRMDGMSPVRRALPVWSYVAAAAVMGLLIGAMSVHLLSRDSGLSMPLIAHVFPAEVEPPADIENGETALLPVRPPVTPPAPKRAENRIQPAARQPFASLTASLPSPTIAQPETLPPTPDIPAPTRPRPRARHLLDIDAQARTVLLNEQPQGAAKTGFLEYMMVRTLPEPAASSAPASIFRNP